MRILKSENGSALLMAMVIILIIGVVSSSVSNWLSARIVMNGRTVTRAIPDQIKDRIEGLVLSPYSWNFMAVDAHNSPIIAQAVALGAAFTVGNPISNRLLKVYNADTNTVYYDSSVATDGFDRYGEICHTYDPINRNDDCPYRYDVFLEGVYTVKGKQVQRVGFEFQHKARSDVAMRAPAAAYTFTLDRNFDSATIETTCVSLGGNYDPNSGMCDRALTNPITCAAFQGYTGPAGAPPCVGFQLAFNCATGAVRGINVSGVPSCNLFQ